MELAFNRETQRPNFIYRQHQPNSFLILRKAEEKGYDPVGFYLVLDAEEDPMITTKKMINLMSLINGREEDVVNIGHLTGKRLLFNIIPETVDAESKTRIIFRTHDGSGVSRENAVLTFDKGVLYDDRDENSGDGNG